MKRVSRNRLVLLLLLCVIAVPTTAVCYSVPLYRMFCQATGLGGTTRRAVSAGDVVLDRMVDVRFTTSVEPGMPWRFVPLQKSLHVHLGEKVMAYFQAENLSNVALTGHATFNVTPDKTGPYFVKLQCFCFDEERLEPGATVQMPVQFFVDPKLADDRNSDDITTITLSYTFFRSLNPSEGKEMSRLDAASPSPGNAGRGQALFGKICASCHAADHNGVGPMLAGVIGRHAGGAPGYRYSDAVVASDITWTSGTLDSWLANPHQLIPGTRMPISVPLIQDRRDLIAFLRTTSTATAASAAQASKPRS
jgi:cytochrome c oxidase assembly protein subunit 11